MDVDINGLVEQCMDAVTEKVRSLKTLNVVVVGKSGVGKSTLVNAVFRESLAETGTGKPVTQHMHRYTKKDAPLSIYDTKGFELGRQEQQEVKRELFDVIKEGINSGDINRTIHCMWYCISTPTNRIEAEEIQWIKDFLLQNKDLRNPVPVIIVLTQSFASKKAAEMKKIIEAENLDVVQVVPVLAQDYELDDDNVIRAYGLDKLIEIMQEVLPEEMVDTLMNVQGANLRLKQKKAQAAVASAAVAAAAEGAVPIPFSDAALLIPTEVAMLASITVIFGFDISKSVISTLLSSVLGTSGVTLAGKTLVTNLLKMIPGVGSVVGGAISGATASVLTTALGEAYIGVMTALFKGEIREKDLGTEIGREQMGKMFKENLKKKG